MKLKTIAVAIPLTALVNASLPAQEIPEPEFTSAHIIGELADGTPLPPEPAKPDFIPAPIEILSSEIFDLGRETARVAHEAELKANPPKPTDLVLNYWDGEVPRPTEKANAP